jgi:hypothetical protein
MSKIPQSPPARVRIDSASAGATAAWYLPIRATCRKMDFIGKLHH